MKRKLDEKDVPTPVEASSPPVDTVSPAFESFGLDKRLLQGVRDAEYGKPTSVQCEAITAALQGKDIVARAHTGSGKTAAYVLPVLQSILQQKQSSSKSRATLALILVPTKELARQVSEVVNQLASHCSQQVRVLNLSEKTADAVVRAKLEESPEVVVATPARAMVHTTTKALKPDSLLHLVIDEADLMLTYDHEEDLAHLSKALPQSVQRILMSATVSTELDSLEKMFCHDPVMIVVEPSKEESEQIQQLAVPEQDKFLYLYAIFKLNLVKGKCLVFVHDIDRCYRLKLYLEQFGVRSCVLNSELPVNTRIHTVEEFNKNVYRIIIAADENEAVGNESGENETEEAEGAEKDLETNGSPAAKLKKRSKSTPAKSSKKKSKRDREYGVARGIDFKHVELVLNFDLPLTARSYVHRIGRTARAGRSGLAVSFAVPTHEFGRHRPTSHPDTARDEVVLAAIEADQAERGRAVRRWAFEDADVRQFEYRCGDAMRAVTRAAVREARTRELRTELLNSERLQRHFAENPDELAHLRHDGESHAVRTQPHLRHVPEYLLPKVPGAEGSDSAAAAKALGFVGAGRTSENGIRKRHRDNKMRRKSKVVRDRQGRKDPLRTFNAKGRGKK